MKQYFLFFVFSSKSKTCKNSYFRFDFEESKKSVNGRRRLKSNVTFSIHTFSYNFFFIEGRIKQEYQFTKT
jgi:cell division protein FtsB